MEISDPHNVKIYNLSAGKSLPDWLSERKRRALQKKSIDIRRRIELIQDFEMPGLSTTVKTSPDGQYILATGIYKPRIRCYDVNNLSMKFERCFDSEVVTFESLSPDYTKLVFLHCDRYVEFHAAPGKYYRLRIPKFGRDMKYHPPSCDLFLVASGPEIYRLNLERGQFLNSFVTEASDIYRCAVNDEHHLLMVGSVEGRVEAWDPRTRNRSSTLDVAMSCITEKGSVEDVPAVTALKFKGALNLGVGMSNGQILLYDIRANRPYLVKDHNDKLPIREIDFHNSLGQESLVLSLDSSSLNFWYENSGKTYTSIEAKDDFNHFCSVPETGMVFIANEGVKIQSYYIPSIGPAPKWAAFLDNLTEELEETAPQAVYDDYIFVTKRELHELGLDHLEETFLVKHYMHGFFIDARLYRKAKSAIEPFQLDKFKRRKVREKIESERKERGVHLDSELPSVNKELAIKLKSMEGDKKAKNRAQAKLLHDDRFSQLFTNPDFQIDTEAEEYRLLNPVISRLVKNKSKDNNLENEEKEEEIEGKASSDEEDFLQDSSSSDDDREWVKEVQMEHKKIKWEKRAQEIAEEKENGFSTNDKKFTMTEQPDFQSGKNYMTDYRKRRREEKMSLAERISAIDSSSTEKYVGSGGAREMTFPIGKEKNRAAEERKRHHQERSKLVRPVKGLKPLHKAKTKF